MPFLERANAMEDLSAALNQAASGSGQVVGIAAEAGGGKSTLVAHFLAECQPPRAMQGWCAHLSTPLPFGPLLDVARQVDPGLETALESGSLEQAVIRLLDLLERRPHPVALVVEDIHWIDQASADLLTVVAQRIARLPVLLILTYRPEQTEGDHPARRLLWKVTGDAATIVHLEPLSLQSIAELAPPGVDAAAVHAASGGNPFFVTELLESGDVLPPTVRDAVLARMIELPSETTQLLELVSVSPSATEAQILDVVAPGWERAAEAAEVTGLLDVSPTLVSFRHDLARMAVESALPTSRSRRLHAQVMEALGATASPGRVMHHALGAGDIDRILAAAPVAARQARDAGSHREAAAHLRNALAVAGHLAPGDLAELEEELTVEAWTIERPEESEAAARRALALRRDLDDPMAIARNLRRIARVRWFLGSGDEAERLLDEAIALLESADAPQEEAITLGYRAIVAGVRHNAAAAAPWTTRAVRVLDRVRDEECRCSVLNDVGMVDYLHAGDLNRLLQVIDLATGLGLHEEVVKGHVNVAMGAVQVRDYDRARHHIEIGTAYADRHQVFAFNALLSAVGAQLAFETGQWEQADGMLRDVLGHPSFAHLPALITQARLKVRRGDPNATEILQEALTLAAATGEAQRMVPAVGAAAEQAWIADRLDSLVPTLRIAHELAIGTGSPRWIGETSLWLHQAGRLDAVPDRAEPGAAAMAMGEWDRAFRYWEGLGVPFEAAASLGLSGEAEIMLEGLKRLDALGATPLANVVRRRLTEMGVARVPRGPRKSTRSNPAGLTARQMDVLHLVVDGFTNPEIADRLYLSHRTVDHHVAAILQKLGVASRREVPEAAERLGILAPS